MKHTKAERKAIAYYSITNGCEAAARENMITHHMVTVYRQEFGVAKKRMPPPDPQFKLDVVASYRKIGRAATLRIPRYSHLQPTIINTWNREIGSDLELHYPSDAKLPQSVMFFAGISGLAHA